MITDKFEIKDFDSFIIGNSYGIEQCWYKEKGTLIHHLAYREGCGYVSILNMYLYLKYKSTGKKHTKLEVVEKMNTIYMCNLNLRIGINSIYFLKKVAIKFLRREKEEKSFSFEVLSKKTGINNNYKEAKELIIKSLEAENPVAILINHRVSDKILKKNFKYHWITITGIRTEDQKTYLTASNWGEKWEYLNFEEIWNDSHNVLDRIFASGLVVMKEQEKPK